MSVKFEKEISKIYLRIIQKIIAFILEINTLARPYLANSTKEEKMRNWSWIRSGLMLAFVLLAAIILVKPIGVSTQYVITDAVVWDLFSDGVIYADESQKTGYGSDNAYLNKSGGKYAKSAAEPMNYSYIFVLAMILGGFIGYMQTKGHDKPSEKVSEPTTARYYLKAFSAGFLVLFGARLAGGCTSGHMMSGIMQTSLSGYLFTVSVFAAAVPVAWILYRKTSA